MRHHHRHDIPRPCSERISSSSSPPPEASCGYRCFSYQLTGLCGPRYTSIWVSQLRLMGACWLHATTTSNSPSLNLPCKAPAGLKRLALQRRKALEHTHGISLHCSVRAVASEHRLTPDPLMRRTALDYDPVHYRARKLLGSARYALGDLPAARDALRFALTQCPEYADAQCDLGEPACHAALLSVQFVAVFNCTGNSPHHNPGLMCTCFLGTFSMQREVPALIMQDARCAP